MKHLILRLLLLLFSLTLTKPGLNAQCIADILHLIENPAPCFFVGTVKTEDENCFNPFAYPGWNYTWKIRGADDGALIATYSGMAFSHHFTRFGGYEFCLEIDKDGNPLTPEKVDCMTYTTCESCKPVDIKFDYLSCSVGTESGCNVKLTATIGAENAVGVRPSAKFVMTYVPTTPELLGGVEPYDLEFDDVPVTYHPQSGIITVAEDVQVPYERGCFQPKIVFKLEYGAGAHYQYGGPGCTEVVIEGAKLFRCIACNEPDNGCQASINATQIANETGQCEPTGCVYFRGDDSGANGEDKSSGKTDDYAAIVAAPNPAIDYIRLDLQEIETNGLSVKLLDTFGHSLFSEKINEDISSKQVDVSALPNGLYYLVFEKDGKPRSVRKVMVLR